MKRIITLMFMIFSGFLSQGQTTETFETETPGASSFTDNGQVFNVTAQAGGPFVIRTYLQYGWNGTANDTSFLDNNATANLVPAEFTVSSQGGVPFMLNSMWVYLGDGTGNAHSTGIGSLTITGKLGGVTKYTATADNNALNVSVSTSNEYNNINMATFGGSDNSGIVIDEYVVTTTGAYTEIALDAMNWTKNSATYLNFDGVNDQVNLGNSLSSIIDPLNTITLEAWVRPTTLAGSGCVFGNYAYPTDNGQMQLLLRRNGSSYNFFVNDGTYKNVGVVNSAVINTWTHVAGVWDGSSIKMYINGILLATTSGVTGSSFVALANSFVIGFSLAGNPDEAFKGDIDEVRVWNRALSQAEIANNMNCELATPATQTGLLAYYQFNQGSNAFNNAGVTSLADSSVAASNGTLNNFALTGAASNWISGSPIVTGTACPVFVLGVNDYSMVASDQFKMYPNPAHGLFKIESEFDGDFQIINQLGQTIKTFTVSANGINEVVLENVSSGIYFIKGINGNKVVSKKLIIN